MRIAQMARLTLLFRSAAPMAAAHAGAVRANGLRRSGHVEATIHPGILLPQEATGPMRHAFSPCGRATRRRRSRRSAAEAARQKGAFAPLQAASEGSGRIRRRSPPSAAR